MKKQNKKQITMDQVEQLLAYKYLDNSYKLFWIKAIMAYTKRGKKKILFRELGKEMIAEAWNMVFEKNITFGRLDRVHHIAEEIEARWHLGEDLPKESVLKYLDGFDQEELTEVLSDLFEETPFTFLEPLYEAHINKRSINKRIPIIEELSRTQPDSIYSIYSSEKYILLNDEWYNFFRKQDKQLQALWGDLMAYYLTRSAGERIKS